MRVEAVLEEGDYFVHKIDGESSSGGLVVFGKRIARSRAGFLDQLCLDYNCTSGGVLCVLISLYGRVLWEILG